MSAPITTSTQQPPRCTNASHAVLKRNLATWLSLPCIGFQSYGDNRGTVLELRNCGCGSTLGKTIRFAREVTPT